MLLVYIFLNFIIPQLTSNEIEMADSPKNIRVPATIGENPVYSLVINDLIANLTYKFKVSNN